jgi:hypothetical protein
MFKAETIKTSQHKSEDMDSGLAFEFAFFSALRTERQIKREREKEREWSANALQMLRECYVNVM